MKFIISICLLSFLFLLNSCCKETQDYQPIDTEVLKWFPQKLGDKLQFVNYSNFDLDTLIVNERVLNDSVANNARCESDLIDILYFGINLKEDTTKNIMFTFRTSDMFVSIPGGEINWNHETFMIQTAAGVSAEYFRSKTVYGETYERVIILDVHNPESYIKKIYLVFDKGIIAFDNIDGSIYQAL